eukprot:gene1736-1896_t
MSYSSNTSKSSHSNSNAMRLPCLYTKQIVKKRKAWSDGILKISINKGIYFATLLDAEDLRGVGLESRQLEGMEVTRLTNRQPFTLAMDQHLIELMFEPSPNETSSSVVQVSQTASASAGSASGSSTDGGAVVGGRRLLKLPKFVPPSRLVRPPPTPNPAGLCGHVVPSSSSIGSNSVRNSQQRSSALDEELDDLWGLAPEPSSTSHSPPLHRPPPTTTSVTRATVSTQQASSSGSSSFLLSQYGQYKSAPSQSSVIPSVTAPPRPNKQLDDPKPLPSSAHQVSSLREKGSIKPVCSSAKQTNSSSFCDWMIESDMDCFYNLSQLPIPTTNPSPPPVANHHSSGSGGGRGVDDVFGIDDSIWNH